MDSACGASDDNAIPRIGENEAIMRSIQSRVHPFEQHFSLPSAWFGDVFGSTRQPHALARQHLNSRDIKYVVLNDPRNPWGSVAYTTVSYVPEDRSHRSQHAIMMISLTSEQQGELIGGMPVPAHLSDREVSHFLNEFNDNARFVREDIIRVYGENALNLL